jgi:hypothetical protein
MRDLIEGIMAEGPILVQDGKDKEKNNIIIGGNPNEIQ